MSKVRLSPARTVATTPTKPEFRSERWATHDITPYHFPLPDLPDRAAIRAFLYPRPVRRIAMHKARERGAIIHNPHELRLPRRYEVRVAATTDGLGLPLDDRRRFVFDLDYEAKIWGDESERAVMAAVAHRNTMYRREIALFDSADSGLVAALLAAQDELARLVDLAARLAALAAHAETEGEPGVRADLDAVIRRRLHYRRTVAEGARLLAIDALVAHAVRYPKRWETPLDTGVTRRYRWRVEGASLAVVHLAKVGEEPIQPAALALRRSVFRPYGYGSRKAIPLAAEWARELVPFFERRDAVEWQDLMRHGDARLAHAVFGRWRENPPSGHFQYLEGIEQGNIVNRKLAAKREAREEGA